MHILKKQSHVALVLMALAGLSLSACANTVQGVGRDIENTGEAVQGAAQ